MMSRKSIGIGMGLGIGAFVAIGILASTGQYVPGVGGAVNALNIQGALSLGNPQTTSVTGTQDDFVLTGGNVSVLRWTGASAVTFDGFKCGSSTCGAANDGNILFVDNSTSNVAMNFQTNAAGSTIGNRIAVSDALGTLTVSANGGAGALLKYDGTSGIWKVVSRSGTQVGGNLFGTTMNCSNAAGCALSSAAASGTVPTLIPNRADTTTGIGATTSGVINAIVGGVTAERWVNTAPSASFGSVATGSLDRAGSITGVGAHTSTVLTFGTTTYARAWCTAVPNDHSVTAQYIEVTESLTAPTFSCFTVTTAAAANCDPFTYHCDLQ